MDELYSIIGGLGIQVMTFDLVRTDAMQYMAFLMPMHARGQYCKMHVTRYYGIN